MPPDITQSSPFDGVKKSGQLLMHSFFRLKKTLTTPSDEDVERRQEINRNNLLTQAQETFARARRLQRRGKHELAKMQTTRCRRILEKLLLTEAKEKISVHFLALALCFQEGCFEEARPLAMNLLEDLNWQQRADMEDPLLYFALSHASWRIGQNWSSLSPLVEGSEIFPDHPQLYLAQCEHWLSVRCYRSAKEMAEHALSRNEDCDAYLTESQRERAVIALGLAMQEMGLPLEENMLLNRNRTASDMTLKEIETLAVVLQQRLQRRMSEIRNPEPRTQWKLSTQAEEEQSKSHTRRILPVSRQLQLPELGKHNQQKTALPEDDLQPFSQGSVAREVRCTSPPPRQIVRSIPRETPVVVPARVPTTSVSIPHITPFSPRDKLKFGNLKVKTGELCKRTPPTLIGPSPSPPEDISGNCEGSNRVDGAIDIDAQVQSQSVLNPHTVTHEAIMCASSRLEPSAWSRKGKGTASSVDLSLSPSNNYAQFLEMVVPMENDESDGYEDEIIDLDSTDLMHARRDQNKPQTALRAFTFEPACQSLSGYWCCQSQPTNLALNECGSEPMKLNVLK